MSQEQPTKVPRVLTCLVKGPLGCLAFLLGTAAVAVLLLPPALGRFLGGQLEAGFARRHAGQLELGDAWIGSLFGRQRVERVILRDPEGDEVLRAELTAPPLLEAFSGPRHHYGPVRLEVESLRLVPRADGRTGLERALEERLTGSGGQRFRTSVEVPLDLSFELTIARLRTHLDGTGDGSADQGLAFLGTLELRSTYSRLVVDGGAPAETGGLALHFEREDVRVDRPVRSVLTLAHAPLGLARVLCPAIRPFAGLLGADVERLESTTSDAHVELRLAAGPDELELTAAPGAGSLTGAGADRLAVACAPEGIPGRALLTLLRPLAEAVVCAPGTRVQLRARDFTLPLEGAPAGLVAHLELELQVARLTLVAAFAAAAGTEAPLAARTGLLRVELDLSQDRVRWNRVRLELERGWLELDGALALAGDEGQLDLSGEIDARAFGPVRLVAREAGLELAPPPAQSPVPAPSLPAPVEVPAATAPDAPGG